MENVKSATKNKQVSTKIVIKKNKLIIYLKSKHNLALLTIHHKAKEAKNEFVTKAQINSLPPKSETCISCGMKSQHLAFYTFKLWYLLT